MASAEKEDWVYSNKELAEMVFDLIRDIKDPEKSETLEELKVVYEEGVTVEPCNEHSRIIKVEFTPTVSHCSLATLIGLCIRVKLTEELPEKNKIDIILKEGTHDTRDEVNKQINDKERVAAALENPNLRSLVEQCIGQSHLR